MMRQQWCHGVSLSLLLVYAMTMFVSRSDALLAVRTKTTPVESSPEIHFLEPRDDGVRLSYRVWKAKGGVKTPSSLPVLLIHPVGIGQGAWYWDQLCQALQRKEKESRSQRVCYALNLLGCGLQDGGDAWNDAVTRNKKNDKKNQPYALNRILSLWIQDCQALLQQRILSAAASAAGKQTRSQPLATSFSFDSLWPSAFPWKKSNSQRCHVVVQGGLAPLGLLLAARCPDQVASLVLTSPPPSFQEATTPLPLREIDQNLQFLTSRPFGDWALTNLERKWAIEVFSNLFLFHQPCDATWIQKCLHEARPEARPPVQAFNAGELQRPEAWHELLPGGMSGDTSAIIRELIQQPVLIVQGQADTKQRKEARLDYIRVLPDCRMETLPGKSVVPWESPDETVQALLSFWQTVENQKQQPSRG